MSPNDPNFQIAELRKQARDLRGISELGQIANQYLSDMQASQPSVSTNEQTKRGKPVRKFVSERRNDEISYPLGQHGGPMTSQHFTQNRVPVRSFPTEVNWGGSAVEVYLKVPLSSKIQPPESFMTLWGLVEWLTNRINGTNGRGATEEKAALQKISEWAAKIHGHLDADNTQRRIFLVSLIGKQVKLNSGAYLKLVGMIEGEFAVQDTEGVNYIVGKHVELERDRSASDIGGPTFDSEKKPLRTSPTSGRKRSAPTAHEFTGYKGQALSHAEVADPDYSRYTPSLYLTTPEPSSGWSTDATKSSKLASSQPQSSDRQPQRTIPKPQPSQRESSILHPPHTNPRYPSLILQPDRRPISQEELASEAKSIYAGLMMIEAKCMHVDRARAAAIAEEGEARTNLASDHWQALIALHRTLLHEHHDFFLASQHPSSSPALRRLAAKYSMPAP
ncbi:hypothetical protein A1F97_05627 [Pyrenophora tritici-repentis]|nr:hypothetical protein A1F97_05627 [Pyrenophora tritici-repentis]